MRLGSSIITGLKTWAPFMIVAVLFLMIDEPARKIWLYLIGNSPAGPYLLPGTGVLLTIATIYLSGRLYYLDILEKNIPGVILANIPIIGKRCEDWCFGALIARLPYFGDRLREAIIDKHQAQGFLRPVLVARYGVHDLEAFKAGKELIPLRTGFFLREVTDEGFPQGHPYRTCCDILIPPAHLLGGEPELFPKELVRTYEMPSQSIVWQRVITQGFKGFTCQHTIPWQEVINNTITLPDEKRALLKKFGIIIER